MTTTLLSGRAHVDAVRAALDDFTPCIEVAGRWGCHLARVLPAGGRLLVAGNGGSAAEAQHLTAELVGRYRDDRRPYSAIALHADTSSLTAIANDFGPSEVFARQVAAHARSGDLVLLMSTSGRSANLLAAVGAARAAGATVWAMTGPTPNPLGDLADDVLAAPASTTATIQELHLVAVHLVCAAFDVAIGVNGAASVGVSAGEAVEA